MDVSDQIPSPNAGTTTQRRECKRHGAYEAKVTHILGRMMATSCPACQGEATEREVQRQQSEKAERDRRAIETAFERAGIPLRFQTRTFDNYDAKDEGQQKALRVARAYADNWPTMRERGTCLIFCGRPGTGKTHLACAIANTVIKAGATTALFTTVSDAMRSIKRSYDKDSGITESQAIKALVDPELLILDEVGADLGTEHSKTTLFDIINKRYEWIRPTIVLTNLDADALRAYLGERIVDRMREGGGKLVTFTWDSHRGAP